MKKFIALAMITLTTSAFAIESTLSFQVQSSGPDMYPCNAGIKHHYPNGSVTNGSDDYTTGTNDPGDYLQDVVRGSYRSYDEWNNTYSSRTNFAKRAWGNSTPTQVFDFGNDLNLGSHRVGNHQDGDAVVITKLNFELSSERFGTEYFVDFCYYGPRFHSGPVGTTFIGKAFLQLENLDSSRNYIRKSKLKVKTTFKCVGKPTRSTGWISQNPNTSFSQIFNQNLGGNALKKCIIRFKFKETSTAKRPNVGHGLNVKVKALIVDPID